MPRYFEPGFILSCFDDPFISLESGFNGFKRHEIFMFRESITFDRYICYAGSVGLLDAYRVDDDMGSEGRIVRLSFILGMHQQQEVTGFIYAPLSQMGEHVQRLPDVMQELVLRIPQKGDMVQLQHDFPLLDDDLTILKAGSVIFLAEVGVYTVPMDYIDITMLHSGCRYDATIQAYALGAYMRVVSSINDAHDNEWK